MRRMKRPYSPQLAKFLIAGGISYVINQAALVLLYEDAFKSARHAAPSALGDINVALLAASIIALEISMVARFAINDAWTFSGTRDKTLTARFLQFNFGSLASPAVAILAVNLLTPFFGVPYLVSNSIGIAVGLAGNWVWSRRVVWPQPMAELAPAPGAATALPAA